MLKCACIEFAGDVAGLLKKNSNLELNWFEKHDIKMATVNVHLYTHYTSDVYALFAKLNFVGRPNIPAAIFTSTKHKKKLKTHNHLRLVTIL